MSNTLVLPPLEVRLVHLYGIINFYLRTKMSLPPSLQLADASSITLFLYILH